MKFQTRDLSDYDSADPEGQTWAAWFEEKTGSTVAQASQQGAVITALKHYAASGGSTTRAFVEVKDSQETPFRVKRTGVIEVLAGPNIGKVFPVSSPAGKTMLANLAAVGENATLMATVIDAMIIMDAVEVSKSQPPAVAAQAQEIVAVPVVPLTQRAWFWPSIVGVTAVGIGAVIVFWPKE